ncbi:MAG: PEP/pyruvate-binding domain-containing protein, partial [Jatrophihabitantaceae bacterium]
DQGLEKIAEQLASLLADRLLDGPHSARLQAELHAQRLGRLVVVRSSSADEDADTTSFAGVFDSLIDVPASELLDAVHRVWLSGFSAKALLQYRRLGRTPKPNHLSVLVQTAIAPQLAGVAFSEPSADAYLEWVPGHGADLMGGLAVPTGERLDRSTATAGWRAELRGALVELSADGCGHDVEWAWDGERLWIVQVRPRTAELAGQQRAGLRVAALYEGDAHDLALGEVAADYHRIRAKRRLPRAIAIAHGASVPAGWLVNWQPAGGLGRLRTWSEQLPAKVVVDASPTERQYIIERAELADTIGSITTPDTEAAFLCREYIKGEVAVLSTVAADGSVYVEASDEGLLALNRGFGSAQPISADRLRAMVGDQQAQALADTTREHARRLHPRAILEWVISGSTLFFVDYSAPAGSTQQAGEPARLSSSRVLSAGLASGRVQHLGIDEVLTESSIAPIISIAQPVSAGDEAALLGQLHDRLRLDGGKVIVAAARPIAVLSMLIGLVDGFLFEEGALLSHLGILLRESGVPAAIVGTGNLPPDGSYVELVHGTVIAGQPG